MSQLIDEAELIRLVQGLSDAELGMCLKAGWVVPAESGPTRRYLDIDVARVRLIHELRGELGIDDEAVPVVLSLIDQLHTLRRDLACLGEAVRAQPEEIRSRLLADIARQRGPLSF
jgi:chaperone modulatory protein CbpM